MDQSLLNHSARTLGKYILESEWDLIVKLIDDGVFSATSRQDFLNKIKGYTYYDALVCSCEGDLEAVNGQLNEDFDDVMDQLGAVDYKVWRVVLEVKVKSNRNIPNFLVHPIKANLDDSCDEHILNSKFIDVTPE